MGDREDEKSRRAFAGQAAPPCFARQVPDVGNPPLRPNSALFAAPSDPGRGLADPVSTRGRRSRQLRVGPPPAWKRITERMVVHRMACGRRQPARPVPWCGEEWTRSLTAHRGHQPQTSPERRAPHDGARCWPQLDGHASPGCQKGASLQAMPHWSALRIGHRPGSRSEPTPPQVAIERVCSTVS